MSGQEEEDALNAARALLGGRTRRIAPQTLWAFLESDTRISPKQRHEPRRVFAAMQIGKAVEGLWNSTNGNKLPALLHLARAVRPHLANRQPGWFRFLLALGAQTGESMFQLSFIRRPRSGASQSKSSLERATRTRRAIYDAVVAGAILKRLKCAENCGEDLKIIEAIRLSINDGDIKTDEEAALKAWHRFRKDCKNLTEGRGTYRLEQYNGVIERIRGCWVAVPMFGVDLPHLPSAQGGAPKGSRKPNNS